MPGLDFANLIPERSASDIIAGLLHLTLGGTRYSLRVLPIRANREWQASLERGLQGLLSTLDTAGDDVAGVLAAFRTATPQLEDALYLYDRDHVLPPRDELEEVATDTEVLRAVLEVWSAANPFASVALSAMRQAEPSLPTAAQPTSEPSPRTNGSPARTAGTPRTSRTT